MRFPSTIPFFKPVGIAIAILVAVACSPSRAKAECGDYVHIVKDAPADTSQSAPAAPRPPCNGPNCSNQPATPSTPLTTPLNDSESSKQVATRSSDDTDANPGQDWRSRETALNLPASIPTSIFHPPRAS